ncbi:hypothetical protein Fmac_017923 [Flemingia macrophylla]|uniref:(+)-neomenthol dehydrogenase n=1 Tax=Flemingia macrophylla TaxID=520843 RepID=A0ABD1M3G8_9FABA
MEALRSMKTPIDKQEAHELDGVVLADPIEAFYNLPKCIIGGEGGFIIVNTNATTDIDGRGHIAAVGEEDKDGTLGVVGADDSRKKKGLGEVYGTRYAVVTGANKGIGFGMCKKLASSGIVVVLTARDEKRGLKAVEKLKEFGLSFYVVFHQLDVDDPASVAALADFIKTQFGKLDILVNNAGISGGKLLDGDALLKKRNGEQIDWSEVGYQTYELAEQCVQTNLYGVERVTEALVPLLQLSISPRIINISSRAGLLKNIPNEWARTMFSDIENLTREKIDEVLNEFQKDFKEGSLEIKGWPVFASAYTMSKAALNAYTRVMAKKYPHFHINSVCPGFVKTDMNNNTGQLSIDEGTETPVMLALMPNGGPSGCFFNQGEAIPF